MSTQYKKRLLLFSVLVVSSCNQTHLLTEQPQSNQPGASAEFAPTPINEPDTSVNHLILQIPFLEKESRTGMIRAWKKAAEQTHYRMVRASDIKIPDWVGKEYYSIDVERRIGRSYDYGEMSGAYGLVLFVVDKTITAANHFSVVILIDRPGARYDVYWIFRNEDLSRFTLGRHSGDVYLQEFRVDGTSHVCDIQWDRKQRRWSCNFN